MDSRNRSTADIMSALQKHVCPFSDANGNYSPFTVSEGLSKIHSSAAPVKGFAISTFNATHSSDNVICPAFSGNFNKDAYGSYAKHLHLGTTRIWNPDGSVNENNWQTFVTFIKHEQNGNIDILKFSVLKKYLTQCYNNDPQELDTGRNVHSLFSSKFAQGTAALFAWDEVFDRLTAGWAYTTNSSELEPYMTIDLVREFFDDSKKAFEKGKLMGLPVAKPDLITEESYTPTMKR